MLLALSSLPLSSHPTEAEVYQNLHQRNQNIRPTHKYWRYLTLLSPFQNKTSTYMNFLFEIRTLPARGELGGERRVVEDPARTAEYTTERTVVSRPMLMVPVETALECL